MHRAFLLLFLTAFRFFELQILRDHYGGRALPNKMNEIKKIKKQCKKIKNKKKENKKQKIKQQK